MSQAVVLQLDRRHTTTTLESRALCSESLEGTYVDAYMYIYFLLISLSVSLDDKIKIVVLYTWLRTCVEG
jgi:hypothetical protein